MSGSAGEPAHRDSQLPRVVGGFVVLAFIGVLYAMSGDFVGARQVVLGRKWSATELVSIDNIDHRDWL